MHIYDSFRAVEECFTQLELEPNMKTLVVFFEKVAISKSDILTMLSEKNPTNYQFRSMMASFVHIRYKRWEEVLRFCSEMIQTDSVDRLGSWRFRRFYCAILGGYFDVTFSEDFSFLMETLLGNENSKAERLMFRFIARITHIEAMDELEKIAAYLEEKAPQRSFLIYMKLEELKQLQSLSEQI
jgi:hypothetical protein